MGLDLGLNRVPGLLERAGISDQINALLAKYGGVYWPVQDTDGTTMTAVASTSGAFDGTYTSVTLAQPGPANTLAGRWDGANDYGHIYSAVLNSLLDRDNGTLLCFARMSGSGVWTDGANRGLVTLQNNASNTIGIFKSSTSNRVTLRYYAGGTNKLVNVTTTITGWALWVCTWDTGADQFKAFFNGAQQGDTQTGLGTWAGDLNPANSVIGAFSTAPSSVMDGYIAHVALLTGVLTAAEIVNLAQAGGVA